MDIRKNGKSGMTLIEILIVIALIAIMATVMIGNFGSSLDTGKKRLADSFCEETAIGAIQQFLFSGKAPTGPNGSNGKPTIVWADLKDFIKGGVPPKDPWDVAYGLKDDGANVFVWCEYGGKTQATTVPGGITSANFSTKVPDYNKPTGNTVPTGHVAYFSK